VWRGDKHGRVIVVVGDADVEGVSGGLGGGAKVRGFDYQAVVSVATLQRTDTQHSS
jgi:hypothetical protein